MEIIPYKYQKDESPKTGFGSGVMNAARKRSEIVVLGSDITASVGLDQFKNQYPERFFSLGIAEQNTVSVAAGLALSGLTPILSTYAVFSAMRALDQIRISVCYNNLHVIIGGAHAGISVGPDGATHQALEDIATLRAIPNLTILSPCDSTQAALITEMAINEEIGPIYIRYGRESVPVFTGETQKLEIGKGQYFKHGHDITIIATGNLVWESIQAAKILEKQNISAEVINIHTIKPIDKDIILESVKKTGRVITAEEHQKIGGLGSAVAEILAENLPTPMKFIGIDNQFGESGQADELMIKYGLKAQNIAQAAFELLTTITQ
ncbi:MAG: transketolase family protein [Bacteroidales bacterium]|nr:transketolase family protein [Bacteroidales bacterium]